MTARSDLARPLWFSLLLLLMTIAAGLVVRFAPVGLPWVVRKYGGSALWAMTVYWLVSGMAFRTRIAAAAITAGFVATAVEFAKLYHAPGLDAFRTTLPGVLLLGRQFLYMDIAVYWIAVVCASLADAALRRRLARQTRTR